MVSQIMYEVYRCRTPDQAMSVLVGIKDWHKIVGITRWHGYRIAQAHYGCTLKRATMLTCLSKVNYAENNFALYGK